MLNWAGGKEARVSDTGTLKSMRSSGFLVQRTRLSDRLRPCCDLSKRRSRLGRTSEGVIHPPRYLQSHDGILIGRFSALAELLQMALGETASWSTSVQTQTPWDTLLCRAPGIKPVGSCGHGLRPTCQRNHEGHHITEFISAMKRLCCSLVRGDVKLASRSRVQVAELAWGCPENRSRRRRE